MLDQVFKKHASRVDQYLQDHLATLNKSLPKRSSELAKAVNYSLFSGGKRFRPLLSMMTAEALDLAQDRVLPFATAIEMVHTYSIIHDDLPSMDDDDERRGKPTTHVVHGDAVALLAGDALITEAPRLIAKAYKDVPQLALELIELITTTSGYAGMVAGQVMDLDVQGRLKNPSNLPPLDIAELEQLHGLKTGELIRASVVGAGMIGRVESKLRDQLSEFGKLIGLCFQLADDIHDHKRDEPEPTGFPKLIGIEKTRVLLEESSERAVQLTMMMGPKASALRDLVVFNSKR